MKKILTAISILILMTFALSSCYVMNHIVGEGAKGNSEVVQRQWYVLWGLACRYKFNGRWCRSL